MTKGLDRSDHTAFTAKSSGYPIRRRRPCVKPLSEWQRQCAAAEAFVTETALEARGAQDIELREVLVHMIAEYAHHLGHADLLREAIDGRRGQ